MKKRCPPNLSQRLLEPVVAQAPVLLRGLEMFRRAQMKLRRIQHCCAPIVRSGRSLGNIGIWRADREYGQNAGYFISPQSTYSTGWWAVETLTGFLGQSTGFSKYLA
jgi:hypothetical protein